MINKILILGLEILACSIISTPILASSKNNMDLYCTQTGGIVERLTVKFSAPQGEISGNSRKFCTFYIDNGIVQIGLETFASDTPSIAATYIKTLPEITEDSQLFQGLYTNPSHNFCKNLGGTMASFVIPGSFSNNLGQADICVFGDGSMVSAWSLIYMANHRDGYDAIKNQVKAKSLDIKQ